MKAFTSSDDSGNRYIEGMGGLWSVALGFNEQRLVDAAIAQFRKLPYYHSSCIATQRPSSMPEQLVKSHLKVSTKAFFANSVGGQDTALKLVRYYNNAIGRGAKRRSFLAEGVSRITVGAASMTGLH